DGNTNVIGNNLVNVIIGNIGNNEINGGGGADWMLGGLGDDTDLADDPADLVTENIGEGNDRVIASTHYRLSDNLEELQLVGSRLQGYRNGLANSIVGTNGNDVIDGGGGADTISGGDGSDVYFVDNALDEVGEVDGEGSNDTVFVNLPGVAPVYFL